MEKELIEKVIEKYTFLRRKIEFPDFCPCYNETKCHDLPESELVCLFCYCPEYLQTPEIPEGKCGIESPHGFYFKHPNLPPKGILDCSNCNIPQTREFARNFLKKFPEEKLRRILETDFPTSKSLFDFLTESF